MYKQIAKKNFKKHLSSEISDKNLKKYFDSCFEDLFSELGLYPCWICVNCMSNDELTYGWGKSKQPQKCPKCGKSSVFAVGTFQARAPKSGEMFEVAFEHLIKKVSDLPITKTPSANLHDFKITDKIKIEAEGSAGSVTNPDGSTSRLKRPGLKRSDTEKKAFSNAEEYKSHKSSHKFFIVTNAIPSKLTAEGRAADGLFDVTKKKDLDSFIEKCIEFKENTLNEVL
ncbi:hypothetical protein AKJ65_01645 [candidate division MSBL1 archaeon SCGC-AAA259E19]|uniref:Uncharacterized protein n=1 Tax=candidate division MSBL1 archaeon SCGC-AAA259E19 TaxID=1698264 RepID=A0A133UMW8_9EURY|nr:hypothetical protein AKJ65_01645 [candidate division MSBL1 archaeon SCGC-AAA259E19]